jgi:exosortase
VGICGLLLVTLPPPFGWDKQLVSGLQSLSSFACSRLMDLTQILHVRRGNIIDISSKPLFVEEACSGVDSQYALMAVAGVLLLLGRAGFWVSLLTIITVPIWAILGNLLRIYLIVIGLEWFSTDLSQGSIHTILGLLVLEFCSTAELHAIDAPSQQCNTIQVAYSGA